MKKIERICNDIIRLQAKLKDSEYKKEILKACESSKKTNYKVSPYELMFLKNNGQEVY